MSDVSVTSRLMTDASDPNLGFLTPVLGRVLVREGPAFFCSLLSAITSDGKIGRPLYPLRKRMSLSPSLGLCRMPFSAVQMDLESARAPVVFCMSDSPRFLDKAGSND
jgi:hypothetical protein